MSLPMSHGMDMPVLLSLRTAKRAWGVLALGGAIEIELIGNDPFTAWAGMLGAMFDRMALLAELKEQQQQLSQQQAILQAAYDRERALSSTVREIGCPVIPLMSGVLLVPLIGAIDPDRARQITKTVLDAVSAERADGCADRCHRRADYRHSGRQRPDSDGQHDRFAWGPDGAGGRAP